MNDLSIIVPAFNEEGSIAEVIDRLFLSCPGAEVIVVDGGSDRTGEIVREKIKLYPTLRYIFNVDDRGKGHAIRVGVGACTRELIAQFDSDLQFRPEELQGVLKPLRDGTADFVAGSRFTKDSERIAGSTPFVRTLGNKTFSFLVSVGVNHRMSDVLAGVKAWRREVTESFKLESNSFSYEVELCIKAVRKGWRVVDVSISTDPRRSGESSVSVLYSGAQVAFDIVKFCLSPIDKL